MNKFSLTLISLDKLVLLTIVFMSILSWYLMDKAGLTLIYSDALSHLNLARLVVDNLEPGFAQLGGVWLPLPHIISLTLIWNNWAWHSGFAGSLISMVSYVVSTFAIYRMVKLLTGKISAALIGASSLAFNLNMLYLQSTALTEPLYMAWFILSALFFIKWLISNKFKYLLLIGLFGFLQVLTRYDGWFVVAVEGMLIFYYEKICQHKSFKETFGKAMLFLFPIAYGILLWLLWNFLIFKDLWFFLTGPYSAHAQQAIIQSQAGLITKGNIVISTIAYFYTIIDNIGLYLSLLSVFGAIALFLAEKKRATKTYKNALLNLGKNTRSLIILFLLAPVIFNILALFLGFSILNVPQLHWNPSPTIAGQWFNVRYGILALPLVAFCIGILAAKHKVVAILIFFIICFQSLTIYKGGVITVIDGTIGSSSFENSDLATELKKDLQPGDRILMSTSYYNPVAFKSGVLLNQIIHEGVSKQWSSALIVPDKYANWIVMANGNIGEPVYQSLVIKENNLFLHNYQLVFQGKHANIYRLKNQSNFLTAK